MKLPNADVPSWRSYNMRIVAGRGTGGRKGPWSLAKREEIFSLTGIVPIEGSLNLRSQERIWLRKQAGVPWTRGLLYAGRIGGVDVVFSKKARIGASPRLVHVYADRHLKTELSLGDGDMVTLQIPIEAIARVPLLHDAVYILRLLRSRLWAAMRFVAFRSGGAH